MFQQLVSELTILNLVPNVEHTEQQKYVDTAVDLGPYPTILDIEGEAISNSTYRTVRWTGNYLQVTLMSIAINKDIGLEIHPDTDQFLRVEHGQGLVKMGTARDNLSFQEQVQDGDAILIPAGTWHNVINTGNEPLKLYSIYAPPHHPPGTIEVEPKP